MHDTRPSGLRATAAVLLEQLHRIDLDRWLDDRREVRRTYAEIAVELRELTRGAVDVSGETVRRWHAAARAEVAA